MLPARDAAARLFPTIGVELARTTGADQESAARLLNFVDRRFTFAQRVLGWNLDPETKLGRVLLLRRQAFEAERSAAFRRADFLWVEAHRALERAATDAAVWIHALDISAFSTSITPEILRERFIHELFIDLHRAVFDSLFAAARTPPPDHRLFVHCAYVERLVDLAGFDASRSAPILRPLFNTWLGVCRDAGAWKQAIAICTRLADRLSPGGAYIDELVVCLLRQTIDRLTRPPGSFDAADARRLKAAVSRVERVGERLGPTGLSMAALARLHQMRAIALGNTGACAEALVEIAIALDHGGHDPQFQATKRQLTDAMESARARASELRDRPEARLDPRSQKLLAEALKGFAPMRLYRSSMCAARTRETAAAADAIDLWRDIGLPRPPEEWPARALALVRALATFVAHPPADELAVAARWAALSANDEALRDLPPEPIQAFLVQRLLQAPPGDSRLRSFCAGRAHFGTRTAPRARRAPALS